METAALLFAPISGLLLGLFVYLVAMRAARRDLERGRAKSRPAE